MRLSSKMWIGVTVGALVGACAIGSVIGGLPSSRLNVRDAGTHWAESGTSSASFRKRVALAYPAGSVHNRTAQAVPDGSIQDLLSPEDSGSDARSGEHGGSGGPRSLALTPTGMGRAETLLRVDPVAALQVVRELPESDRRDELLEQAVMEWGGADSKASVEWVRQIHPASLRNRLLGAVALGMATDQPRAAAHLASEEMQPGSEQDRAAVGIVQRWIQSDPDGAAAWVEQFPQNPLRHVVVETLLSGWFSKDPAGARQWVVRLPEGGLRTQATSVTRRWLVQTH